MTLNDNKNFVPSFLKLRCEKDGEDEEREKALWNEFGVYHQDEQ